MQNIGSGLITPSAKENTVTKFHRVLIEQGMIAALRVLNSRTPHRYTGVYKYTPHILKNLYLVDAFDPTVFKGADVPNNDAYCLLLPDAQWLAFGRSEDAPDAGPVASPVVSYCGVLLLRSTGEPFGSLCHYDVARCEEPATQMPYLEAVAPYIVAQLEAEGH